MSLNAGGGNAPEKMLRDQLVGAPQNIDPLRNKNGKQGANQDLNSLCLTTRGGLGPNGSIPG